MSTHWQLECTECGRSTDWAQDGSTNNIGVYLVPLCRNGKLGKLIGLAHDFQEAFGPDDYYLWEVLINIGGSPQIHLPSVFSRACAGHFIWPRNEYGSWLNPCDDEKASLI